MLRFIAVGFLSFALARCVSAQNPPASDPQALSYAAQSIAALTHGIALSDVALSGDAIWVIGPDRDTATVTLIASGRTESRVDIQLAGGSRIEVRSSLGGGPEGQWTNADGKHGLYASHNCWTDPVWFFPALSSIGNFADSASLFSYVGKETWNGLSAYHLRVYRSSKNFKDLAQLSTMDFYLDPGSFLPLGISFKTHSDIDVRNDIATQILFADYRSVNGLQIPFRIQRHLGGNVLDVTVTGVNFNSGISDSTFSIR